MPEVTSHAPGAFSWVELATTDQNAAKGFYGKLFGWTFRDEPIGPGEVYMTFQLAGRPVAAAYTLDSKRHPGVPPHWMVYVATADADETARRTVELGGKVETAPFDVMELGRMAVLSDPTGAALSVWQAKTHRGLAVHNEPGSFCWGQLNTNDTARAEAFYTALFGWTAKTGSDATMTYTEWLLGGAPIGGMMAFPEGAQAPPYWLAYFAVADCDAMAEKAASLGAKTYVPPTDIAGTGRFAVFGDPQGATFAIYRV
jgi:predicted enzyme related to lactoylglutathione lyase